MNYVGIDIAKLNHFASVINSDGEVLVEPFEFTNDFDGFHKLIHKLDPFEPDSLIIGLESTAHYSNTPSGHAITYSTSSFHGISTFACSTPSGLRPCVRVEYARPKPTRSIPS